MSFVVDTVGLITTPAGETVQGVILAVPVTATSAEAREMMREAARMWAERVSLKVEEMA